MTREMALVGIPTLSVYQDKLLSVDNILINQKLLVYNPRFTFQDVHDLMKNNQQQKNAYMNYGKKAYELFISTINNNLNKYD